MPIPTHIAVHLTRRLVEQGGPKPRFVRRPHSSGGDWRLSVGG